MTEEELTLEEEGAKARAKYKRKVERGRKILKRTILPQAFALIVLSLILNWIWPDNSNEPLTFLAILAGVFTVLIWSFMVVRESKRLSDMPTNLPVNDVSDRELGTVVTRLRQERLGREQRGTLLVPAVEGNSQLVRPAAISTEPVEQLLHPINASEFE